jgi:SPP1 family predicted phage head-tail adaptor
MIQSGQLTQVVTLQRQSTTTDRFGQRVEFPAVADVAARVSPFKGREFFSAGAMQSPATLEIEIYYRPDIDASWRLTWMGKQYEFIAEPIDTDATHESLVLMCRTVAAT